MLRNNDYSYGESKQVDSAATCELSVVIPCLNEADTLASCIQKAQNAIKSHGIDGEVIVSDNGSTDDSLEIAGCSGARLVRVSSRGYGNALMGGLAAARGRYVIMADADASYDLSEIPHFYDKIREGYDLVQGCRLPSGGGRIAPGAMTFSHRWLGNPMLSWIARWWFGIPIKDIYCGMRIFSRQLYHRLDQRCTGMEFATEMIIKSCRHGARIAEIPITLYPDGRRSHASHLRTVRDGWRTLRFFLMCSPKWLFLNPGRLMFVLGIIGFLLGLFGMAVGPVRFNEHGMITAGAAILLGYQAMLFAIGAKAVAIREGLSMPDPRMDRFFDRVSMEVGLAIGTAAFVLGSILLLTAIGLGFRAMNYAGMLRWVICAAVLSTFGLQTILASFFIGFLGLMRR